jgi:hypothetical protein
MADGAAGTTSKRWIARSDLEEPDDARPSEVPAHAFDAAG